MITHKILQGYFIACGVIGLLGLLASCDGFAVSPAHADPGQGEASSVVLLQNSGGHGTGVNLGDGLILTAAHVGSEIGLEVVTEDGQKSRVQTVLIDNANDIAILRVMSSLVLASSPVNCDPVAVGGAEVTIVGYPLGLGKVTTRGHIASTTHGPFGRWRLGFIVDGTIAPGNSGGPVFNSRREVIGIAVGEPLNGGTAFPLALVVPGSSICKALDLLGLTV